jgi:hypothetical protein
VFRWSVGVWVKHQPRYAKWPIIGLAIWKHPEASRVGAALFDPSPLVPGPFAEDLGRLAERMQQF